MMTHYRQIITIFYSSILMIKIPNNRSQKIPNNIPYRMGPSYKLVYNPI